MRLPSVLLVLGAMGGMCLAACARQIDDLPEPQSVPAQRLDAGRALLAEYGCGACHTIPGVPGADSLAGPSLDRYYERRTIAGRLANTETNLIAWIQDPQGIEPGNIMPN